MTRKLSILIPIIGLAIVIVWVIASSHKVPHVAALASPPVSPYENAIAATGIVEASNRNYNLAPPISGQLTGLYVKEGDTVHTTSSTPSRAGPSVPPSKPLTPTSRNPAQKWTPQNLR